MGIIYIPSYGNIFMDHFERKYVSPFFTRTFINLFKVHRRNIFIWTESKEQLIRNLNELDKKHYSIKF